MQINFAYDPSVANAPSGFSGGLAAAASYLDALITNPIMITIQVGWGETDGFAISGNEVATGGPTEEGQFYSTVRNALAANATSAADALSVANLPATDPLSGDILEVSAAQATALGVTGFFGSAVDGSIGFGTTVPFTFDPANRAVPGKTDFIGVAEHEMTHALGRISGLFSTLLPGVPSGTRNWSITPGRSRIRRVCG